MRETRDNRVYKIAVTGLMAALSYVAFTFLQIKVPLPGGDATSFHLGNTICVLGALLAGSFYGGLGGAIGMTIGDLMDPVYIVYAPKTFILKFCIGIIAGAVAHRFGRINEQTEHKAVFRWAVLSAVCGLGFNAVFDPLFGYVYKLFIIGKPAAEVVLKWNFLTTGTNAVLSAVVSVVLYMAIRPVLKKQGLLSEITM
ncbi:MAG: ECF transporter S component [Lachnospiraceae bacterium]|nr:ECF transporter S component [Lachnospiraceae bacterium]